MTIHIGPKEIIAFFIGLMFFAWMCYDMFGVLSKALNDFNNSDPDGREPEEDHHR